MGYQVSHISQQALGRIQLQGLHREDRVWTRTDIAAKTMKTTMRGGPNWDNVTRRVTISGSTGQVLKDEPAGRITRSLEHAVLVGGPHDTITALIYRPDALKA